MRLTERGPLPPGRADDELLQLVRARADAIRQRRRRIATGALALVAVVGVLPLINAADHGQPNVNVAAEGGHTPKRTAPTANDEPGLLTNDPLQPQGPTTTDAPISNRGTAGHLSPGQGNPRQTPTTTGPDRPAATAPTTLPVYPTASRVLYWVTLANGDNFYTSGANEYANVRGAPGSVDHGAAARLFEPGVSGTVPLRRYYHPSGYHFFCSGDTCDAQAAAAGYTPDGAGPGNVATAQIPGTVAFYRFSSSDGTLHLYSTALEQGASWHLEGQEGWVASP